MNRNVLYGGVAAVVVLLGAAGYLIFAGKNSGSSSDPGSIEDQGPVALNPVSVITDHVANQTQDGRKLTIGFSSFELKANAGQTTSAVFSTTWRLKLGADERVLVASANLNGFMKSAGTPPPAPAATPPATSDAVAPATPAADSATPATAPADAPASGATPAEQPAAPPPAPAPVAGDGVARVIVALGGEASVTEWRDHSGAGWDRKLSKAVSFASASSELRAGGTIPVTVTVELSGAASAETIAKLNSIELQLFVENAPIPAAAPAEPTDTTVPAPPLADAPATTEPAAPSPAAPAPSTPAPATPPAGSTPN